jgi:hypothetical protein
MGMPLADIRIKQQVAVFPGKEPERILQCREILGIVRKNDVTQSCPSSLIMEACSSEPRLTACLASS